MHNDSRNPMDSKHITEQKIYSCAALGKSLTRQHVALLQDRWNSGHQWSVDIILRHLMGFWQRWLKPQGKTKNVLRLTGGERMVPLLECNVESSCDEINKNCLAISVCKRGDFFWKTLCISSVWWKQVRGPLNSCSYFGCIVWPSLLAQHGLPSSGARMMMLFSCVFCVSAGM